MLWAQRNTGIVCPCGGVSYVWYTGFCFSTESACTSFYTACRTGSKSINICLLLHGVMESSILQVNFLQTVQALSHYTEEANIDFLFLFFYKCNLHP